MQIRVTKRFAVLAGLSLAMAVLAGCTDADPDRSAQGDETPIATASPTTAAVPTALPTYVDVDLLALQAKGGDDEAEANTGVEDVVYFDTIQQEWERVTTAWPLPVPEKYPFPEAVKPIEGGTWYSVGYSLQEATRWWDCAARNASYDAHDAGDDAAAAYWVEALRLWWLSDASEATISNHEDVAKDIIKRAEQGNFGAIAQLHGASACLEESEQATALDDDRQVDWEAATATFKHQLPDGAVWPSEVPEDWPAGGTNTSGEDIATYFWVCLTLAGAESSDGSGDSPSVEVLFARVNELPPPHARERGTWDLVVGQPSAGDRGLCRQWLRGWAPAYYEGS